METRILKWKLVFVHHLVNPGLITETKDIIKQFELPDMKSVT